MVEHLLYMAGLSVSEVEVKACTVPLRVAADGAAGSQLGTLPASAEDRAWSLLAVRVDAGPAEGLASALVLGTAEGKADLWSGSAPLGVWMPTAVEVPRHWDGALWGSMESAEVAGLVAVDETPTLGGTLTGTVSGTPYDVDGALTAFSGTDFLTVDYNGGGASGLRTVAVDFTADFATPGGTTREVLMGRGSAGAGGLEMRVKPSDGAVVWGLHGPGGAGVHANNIGSVGVTNLGRQWLFMHAVFDDSELCSLYRFDAGSAAVAGSHTDRPVAATHDLSESTSRVGTHYSELPWNGAVHHLALFDGHLTTGQMGAIAEAGAPTIKQEGVTLLGSTAGMAADRAAGGSVTLLLVRRRL